ncbi:MAG: tRNA dihydrouridine synthase DusB [Chlamydiae bacterium CG10_big_fil_rev_8_21_14_0_10_42_34]|nr:MAG: tRNA dihydrouridine synthase DusB [Chlamydiae bacterium CG10_big_fil_rev_8_21_14_0_10_42_34]
MSEPFFIGSAELPNKVLYAPLAGCSDLPFRRMSCRYRPGIVYCEMVKIDALVRNDANTYRMLDYESGMHPIGAQLCGSKPKIAAEAARIVEDLGFDVIDFNCGCPVDKVTKDGSGSGMLKTPDFIGEMLSAIVGAVKIPVTVKIRAGWDDKSINAVEITRIAERSGAKAIAIHGRTREQGYKGKANWDHIKQCKEAAREIRVIGNGDVFDANDALRMLSYTGCDAVLVSRGTMGQPWIAEDILRAIEGLPALPRTVSGLKENLMEHFEYIIKYQPEKQSLLDMRRVGCWYLKRLTGVRELRMLLNRSASTSEVFQHLQNFQWEAIEFMKEPVFAISGE